jgi:hypothetical protein
MKPHRKSLKRHCEERSDEAIQELATPLLDCFAALAINPCHKFLIFRCKAISPPARRRLARRTSTVGAASAAIRDPGVTRGIDRGRSPLPQVHGPLDPPLHARANTKGITASMLSAPTSHWCRRSTPSATPAQSGICGSACSSNSSRAGRTAPRRDLSARSRSKR